MLYIFDLGNVIIDIDFKRVMAIWSQYSAVPLPELMTRFSLEHPAFQQHERGEISDPMFADALNQQLNIELDFSQFSEGWQAIFIGVRKEVIKLMNDLRQQGHRVVILSNTNSLHTQYWPKAYPEVVSAADKIYLSQEMGMRKPEARIYQSVLEQEGYSPENALFFDDNRANIIGAEQVGIKSILVDDAMTILEYFKER